MRNAYSENKSMGLSGEAAYEELYSRLARWTGEAAHLYQSGQNDAAETKLDRCITLVGDMDRGIDISDSREVALTILSLHRFAIRTLVKAKGESDPLELEGLVKVFVSLGGIFAAIQVSQAAAPSA